MLVLQNDFISSGKLFLLSNKAKDIEWEKMRKAGSNAALLCVAIRERRDSLPGALESRLLAPAINPVGKAVLEPTLFLLLPPNNNRPEAGEDLAQISPAI